jgi:3-oxoacyl-[acyl-carrier-protein] synthase-1
MIDSPRVAVTGLGFVSSIGIGAPSVLQSVKASRTGIRIHPELEAANAPVRLAGVVNGFDFPSEYPQSWTWISDLEISRQQLRSLPPHGVYAHVALKEALQQAELTEELLRDGDTGLLTASAGSTRLLYRHVHKMLERGVAQCHPFVMTCSIAGTLSFNLAASLGIRGVSGPRTAIFSRFCRSLRLTR